MVEKETMGVWFKWDERVNIYELLNKRVLDSITYYVKIVGYTIFMT